MGFHNSVQPIHVYLVLVPHLKLLLIMFSCVHVCASFYLALILHFYVTVFDFFTFLIYFLKIGQFIFHLAQLYPSLSIQKFCFAPSLAFRSAFFLSLTQQLLSYICTLTYICIYSPGHFTCHFLTIHPIRHDFLIVFLTQFLKLHSICFLKTPGFCSDNLEFQF